jgi:tetratricopeptide (TPR) repeat protein
VAEITGQTAIGAPFVLSGGGDAYDRKEAGEKMALAVEILANILDGLFYYYKPEPDYPKALAAFKAADVSGWPEEKGKHTLYVLLGNTAGKTGDLEGAEAYYRMAVELQETYPSSYLGLGDVYLHQAIIQTEDNKKQIDPDRLAEAITAFEQARQYTEDSPYKTTGLAAKAKYGLGEAYYLKVLISPEQEEKQNYLDQAFMMFTNVIEAYNNGEILQLQERAAEAHARRGLIYEQWRQNYHCALKEYQATVKLATPVNPNQDTYHQRIVKLAEVGADESQCKP